VNRIDALFKSLRKKRRKAFIVYIAAGDPSLGATEKLIHELEKNGVDLIELGIPFSDPLTDGPTIQKASQRALSQGVNIKSILKLVQKVRKKVKLPIVFMTYYNLVLHYGIKKFVTDSKKAGADGIIIPDLPPEEGDLLIKESRRNNFDAVFLAAPTSTKSRLKKVARKANGFIYYVSITGTTGTRKNLPADIAKNIKALKRITKKPICCGFGISNPEQAEKISRFADGIIVGSAVIKIIEKNIGKKCLYKKVADFTSGMEEAVHRK